MISHRRSTRKISRAAARRLTSLLTISALLATPTLAHSATGTWSAGSGEWTIPSNWTNNLIPNAPDDTALFESILSPAGTVIITNAGSTTVGNLIIDTPSAYRFDASGTASSFTLASTTGSASLLLTGSVGFNSTIFTLPITLASNLSITNSATAPLIFTGALSGTSNLTLNGNGEVDLRGNNANWSPPTINVNSGLLSTVSGTLNSLGNISTGTINVAPGASLDITAITPNATAAQFTKTLNLSGPGTSASAGALAYGATANTLAGPITLAGQTTFFAKSSTSLLNIGRPLGNSTASSLSGTGTLIKSGLGTLQLNIPASHTGGTILNAGTLVISSLGSLVGTGNITINPFGLLTINKPAGNDPLLNSLSPNSISLNGGYVLVTADISLANLFSPATTSGTLFLNTNAPFTAGGTNTIDFSTLPSGAIIRLALGNNTSLPASLALIPDALTHTLRFGGNIATSTINANITDINGIPTNVDIASSGGTSTLTLASSASTYTGVTTLNAGANVSVTNPSALGSPVGGTILNNGATLTLSAQTSEPFTILGGSFLAGATTDGAILIKGGLVNFNFHNTASVSQTGGTVNLNTPWDSPYNISGGSLTITVASTGALTVSGGLVNILAPSSQPMLLTGGTVNLSAAASNTITLASGGLLRQLAGGSLAPQSLLLTGGRISLPGDSSLPVLLNPASTGGIVSLDYNGTFTNGGTNLLNLSTLPGGGSLTITTQNTVTIPAALLLRPDNTSHTLRFGGANTSGTLTINATVGDFGAPTNLAIGAATTVILGTANTYSGVTTVEGTLILNNANSLGTASGTDADATILNPGGRLANNFLFTIGNEKIIVNGGTLALNSTGPVVLNGSVYIGGNYSGPVSGTGTINSNIGTNFTGTYTGTGALNVISNTLNFGANSVSAASFTMTGGSVIAANITSVGLATFGGGSASTPTFLANGGLLVNGPSTFSSGTLTLPLGQSGTLNASLQFLNNSLFDNEGTLTLLGGVISGNSRFINNNLINAPVIGTFAISTTFLNNSTVNVSSGLLNLQGGDDGSTIGNFNLAAGSTLGFGGGTFTLAPSSAISGPGNVAFSGGVTTVNGIYNVTGNTSFTGGSVTFNSTTASFSNASALNVAGGSVDFVNNNPIVSNLTQSGGVITGLGSLTINGAYNWNGGPNSFGATLAFPQTLVKSGMSITGNYPLYLSAATLTNAPTGSATINLSGGSIVLQSGSTFANAGTLTLLNGQINTSGTTNSVLNTGLINMPATAGNFLVYSILSSPGAINLLGGSFYGLGGGSIGGTVSVGAASTLNLTNFNLLPGSSISGSGNVIFSGAINFNTNYTLTGKTTFTNGFLTFAPGSTLPSPFFQTDGNLIGDVTFNGLYSPTNGTLQNATVLANGGINIVNRLFLSTGTLTNSAVATFSFGNTIDMRGQSTFMNSGTINASGGGITNYDGTGNLFQNSGIININAPGTGFTISTPMTNTGTINLLAGSLTLGSDNNPTSGPFNLSAGTTLTFGGARTMAADSSISGPGSVLFAGGPVTILGNYSINGTTAINALGNTTITFPDPIASLGSQLLVTGGILDLAANNVSVPNLKLTGGTLTSTGTLQAGNTFQATGGTLKVPAFTAPANSTISALQLIACLFTLPAAGTLAMGNFNSIGFAGGSQLVNNGVINATGSVTFGDNSLPGNSFTNNGVLNITNGSPFYMGVPFANSGTINLTSGNFQAVRGDSGLLGGTFNLGPNSILLLMQDQTSPSYHFGPSSIINGAGTITIAAPTSIAGACNITGLTNLLGGTATFAGTGQSAAAISGSGGVIVAPGASLTSDGVTATSLAVNGTHTIRPNGSAQGASKLSTLAIAVTGNTYTGKLDLTNNALVLQAANPADKSAKLSDLQAALLSGKNNGTWDGTGITSSTIAADPSLALALVDNADLHLSSFRGQSTNDNSLVLTPAHLADANLDNKVDAFDLNLLAAHWQQQSSALWSAGDFNNDGKVDAFDLNLLAANWQFGSGGGISSDFAAALAELSFANGQFTSPAPVPEPASLLLVMPAALLLFRRAKYALPPCSRRNCATVTPVVAPRSFLRDFSMLRGACTLL